MRTGTRRAGFCGAGFGSCRSATWRSFRYDPALGEWKALRHSQTRRMGLENTGTTYVNSALFNMFNHGMPIGSDQL